MKDDANTRALRQVQAATDSKPVRGEDLLRSPHLKRGYRDVKRKLAKLGPLPLPLKPTVK